MFAYAVDPIALLESANAKLPHPLQDPANSQEHAAPELKANLADREQILRLAKLYLDSPYQL